ncbi:MAG: nucleotidyltransferase domain-containing protein [Lachnospiraceae bacterium]|nr:nucleotidyltransferase domain-containing protein [Lachnospiraceae bacterium]MCI9357845.1 nucleotidyltransferase domain-containing protein [Lachnospiraceae bacterium]
MNLDAGIREEIIGFAQKCKIRKVILFGSRARGDNKERSDIDLAVSGGDITEFRLAVDDEIRTLLMFDVVDLDGPVPKTLSDSIEKEGIILYEKI